ncbi:diiron oxygenase [Pseudomonas sp. REP124]|uniref:diiron oxygenase n=1 Tax=Pseudomonas sp. REP124 TaxID=2875731 RepID=UPI001CC90FA7|nr:diiron oxygenase [Pseudomonas sp. REP124]MBZ9784643.1 diiron oxygenase [Pseudomonas sp. REP124]
MKTIIGPDLNPTFSSQHFTLHDWDNKASVRTNKHCCLLPLDLQQQLKTRNWFPLDFLPYLNHPAISNRAITHHLSASHLVYFLDYTTLLEHRIVNRSVETIIYNELGISIPTRMKAAALQLYTDEGYHALFSSQLAEQVADFYGITVRQVTPRRIARLNNLIERTPERRKKLCWFLIGFVSETIIAKELLDACRDELVSSVQDMLRDHLNDEARHSRYFCEVFHYLWLNLDSDQRAFSTSSLVEILLIFFEIDEPWLGSSLRGAGLDETSVLEILSDLTSSQACLRRARSGARPTLKALTKAGVFEIPSNRQIFFNAGLLDE